MTIISNHRVHSYKASASVRTRDISPKKINIQIYMPLNKHHTKQIAMPHRKHCTKQIAIPKIDDEIKPSYIPSTLLKTMANYTNGVKYKVIMPIEGEDDVIEDSADDCIDDDMEKNNIEHALQQGKIEGKIEIAKQMRSDGEPTEKIQKYE